MKDERKGGRWIRLDTTWSSSEWVANLHPEARLCWVELLCYMKAHGYAGRVKAMAPNVAARSWGVTRNAVTQMIEAAKADSALETLGDEWVVTGWDTYQPDKSAPDRQRRYRERQQEDTPKPTPEPVTPVTRNARDVTPTETKTETVTETRTEEEVTDIAGWLGRHARCLDSLPVIVRKSVWGIWGPHGTQEHDWRDIAPGRRPPILATAILTYVASVGEKRDLQRRFFAKILERAIDDAIASERQAEQLGTEQAMANEHRTAAKAREEAEIARLNAAAAQTAGTVSIPAGSKRGGEPGRVHVNIGSGS